MRLSKFLKPATLESLSKYPLSRQSTSQSFHFGGIGSKHKVSSFCQNTAGSTLTPLGPRISKALGPFLLVTSEDTLSLVLEALSVVLEIDGDWMTQDLASDIVGAVLDVWTKNVKGGESD